MATAVNDNLWMAGFFLLVGLAFIGFALWQVERGFRSWNWHAVQGQVSGGKLEEDSDGQFEAVVVFRYTVNGTGHEARETFKPLLPTRENAAAVLAVYRTGQPVWVFFDPDQPQVAVLRQGVRWSAWFGLLMGMAIFGVGAAVAKGWIVMH
jgi:hypothetical protein